MIVVTPSATMVETKPNESASVPPTAKKNIDQLRPVSGMAKPIGVRLKWAGTLRRA
jgi:hypothetical protein